ncbi:hypothetical protein L484_018025 [Morus notabilis]|uniref:Uncharacterized protein n=1 Tax=Morus notabilis TaxID=981085 RepID=W9RU84_9ROSA|nr:hypothetical protein L484_018025 [Morus notabilis]
MKLKTLIQTLLFSHVRRLLRSLSAAKSKAVSALVHSHTLQLINYTTKKHKNDKLYKKNKIFFGSFRLHYNWCSSKNSHVLPVPAPVYDGLPETATATHFYYDSTWNSVIPTGQYGSDVDQYGPESQLYGYLQWLEEKKVHGKKGAAAAGDHDHDGDGDGDDQTVEVDDIDKLADLFIASCHAKFILEKQESARRFKEMLERSA